MAKDNTYKWKVFLLFTAQALNITVLLACPNYGETIQVDHKHEPMYQNAVFTFTRKRQSSHLSEVNFLEDDFIKLLQCFSRQVDGLNSCTFEARYLQSFELRKYKAYYINDTTSARATSSSVRRNIRSYYCRLPPNLVEGGIPPNTVSCTEEEKESDCFKDTDFCISLNPKTQHSTHDVINIMWANGGIFTYQYNSTVVGVSPCNSFTTMLPEMISNSEGSDEKTDNAGIIAGTVCGSLLLIVLIIIGILCWKRPVIIWKRGRHLSTDPTSTGVSSQPFADNVIHIEEEVYPSSEANQHALSTISTSDYVSLDSENIDTLEVQTRHKESIKDVYATIHKSRKRAKKQRDPENSKNATDQNSDTSEKPQGKRKSIKDVYASIHKSRKRAKNHKQHETHNENTDQTPQMEHDKTDVTNDVQNGDKKTQNKYSRLHDTNVNIENPYDDLLEPNDYHDAASAEAINDLSNEESNCRVVDKPVEEASNHIREDVRNQATTETDSKLITKPVIPSKPQLLTKQGNKEDEISTGNKAENKDRDYFNVAKGP